MFSVLSMDYFKSPESRRFEGVFSCILIARSAAQEIMDREDDGVAAIYHYPLNELSDGELIEIYRDGGLSWQSDSIKIGLEKSA